MPAPRRPLVLTPASVAATLGVFLVIALCVRLGFWQLDRAAQRRALNAVVEARAAAPGITDPDLLRDTAGVAFRRARFAGRWDHDRSIVLPGRSHRGAPGVHLLTPLRVDGSGLSVLVNRGWVPAPDGASIDFAFFDQEPAAVVEGILLPFPSRADSRGRARAADRPPAPATPAAAVTGPPAVAATPSTGAFAGAATDSFRRLWFAIDEAALRAQFPYPLAAMQLQLTRDEEPAVAPLPAAPPALDAGPHLGYAIQWFSFALIGLVGWFALVVKARGRGRPELDVPPA